MGIKERGNLSSTRKPVLDPKVSYELGKLKQTISRVTWGTSFPRNPTTGDMHYYTGTDEAYTQNNWYLATPEQGWQSANAQAVSGENISGAIPSGVTIEDYLSKFGGSMEGAIEFHADQTIPAESLVGAIPSGVTIEDYISRYGDTLAGSLILAGYNLTRVGQITGLDTDIKITLDEDGKLSLDADSEITLTAATLTLAGVLAIVGDVDLTGDLDVDGDGTFTGDLQVNGGDIGLAADTDLIQLVANAVTVNGTFTATGKISGASADIGDGTNEAQFATDGELTLHGTARVTKSRDIGKAGFKAPGVNPADEEELGIATCWAFDDTVQQYIMSEINIPSDMDRSVAPTLKAHWSAAATTGTAVWQLEYLYRAVDEDRTAAAQETLTEEAAPSGTANGLVETEMTGIDAPSSTDKVMLIRISRKTGDANDDMAGDARLTGIQICYTANKLGTAT